MRRAMDLLLLIGFILGASLFVVGQAPSYKTVLDKLHSLSELPVEWRYHPADLKHAEAVDVNDDSWTASPSNTHKWSGAEAWFRADIKVPSNLNGYELNNASLRLEMDADDEVIVYVNGQRVAMGGELEPVLLAEKIKPGQRIVTAIKVLALSGDHQLRTRVLVEADPSRPDPIRLAQELESAASIVKELGGDDPSRQQQLDNALNAVDLGALQDGKQSQFDRSLQAAQKALDPLESFLQQFTIHAAGNSHIDMAWLWPRSETVGVTRRTFTTALQLMNEYPEYTFTQSTAQMSAWMQEKYPDLFAGIQQRVKEGRWELVGGMWVEPDLNMPAGESLVRQLLIGKRYFQKEFGKDIRIGWNPDSFGYNWQLPQIYKKSGVDYFVTQKIYWNDTTRFPYHLFWWQAPDGSRILTYFPHDYVNFLEPKRMADDVASYVKEVPQFPEILHLYGIGDHGGGPTRVMLDRGEEWSSKDVVYPKLVFGTAGSFFQDVEKALPRLKLPVWNDELYLEFHRGVFTTQAETKRRNRESEELLLNAEKFSSIAFDFGKPYPSEELNSAWKKVLFNQFHDIAAGSGIAAIYKDAARDYAEVAHTGQEALDSGVQELAAHVNTSGPGVPLLVFNPLGWSRSDVVEADVQMPGRAVSVHVVDARGQVVPSQITGTGSAHRIHLLIKTENVPSLGYKLYHVVIGEAAGVKTELTAKPNALENAYLRVTIDPASGCITSLYDKRAKREALSKGTCGNLLQAFRDKPKQWDAWNIDADFENVKWDIDKAESIKLVERGPVRASIRVVRKFQNSTFTQKLVLYAGSPRLDVVTDADWHEKHILIKAAITIPVQTKTATFEIPYGSIERPTTRNTPSEKAKFEVPALRWGDLGDNDFGVSLLNNCKYGYDAKGNVLRLSLLRSPEWPDPHADEGKHHFTYSFYPHKGRWKEAETVRQGYQLNYPMWAVQPREHQGTLPGEWSFARLAPSNLVLTAVKKSEDDNGILFRFYDFAGKKTAAVLTLNGAVQSAVETNLMEKDEDKLPAAGRDVQLAVNPYEIKTIKVFLKPMVENNR